MVWQKEYSICYDKRHIPRLSTVSNSERHFEVSAPLFTNVSQGTGQGIGHFNVSTFSIVKPFHCTETFASLKFQNAA